MTVVIDASLALKWALLEDRTEEALELWDRWQESSERLISPPIFRSDIANALHQRVRRREINPVDAAEMLDTLISLVDTNEPSVLYDRALALAGGLGQNSIHESLYLALAELWGCEMWTADHRFARSARKRSANVRCVGDDA